MYTIFAALGIGIVSWLNFGLKIARAYTIYLVALLLGMVQLAISLLPTFGLFGVLVIPIAIIVPTSIMAIASFLLKDFQLDWKRGYSSVAITLLAIVAIQFLFSIFCWELISGLV